MTVTLCFHRCSIDSLLAIHCLHSKSLRCLLHSVGQVRIVMQTFENMVGKTRKTVSIAGSLHCCSTEFLKAFVEWDAYKLLHTQGVQHGANQCSDSHSVARCFASQGAQHVMLKLPGHRKLMENPRMGSCR